MDTDVTCCVCVPDAGEGVGGVWRRRRAVQPGAAAAHPARHGGVHRQGPQGVRAPPRGRLQGPPRADPHAADQRGAYSLQYV